MKKIKYLLIIISLLFVVSCTINLEYKNDNKDIKIWVNNFNNIKIKTQNKYLKIHLDKNKITKNNVNFTINNNDIFITSMTKNLIKISLNSGKIEWIKELATIPQDNFTFNNNNIYFNGTDNNFYVLNYINGNIENIFFNSNVQTIFDVQKPYIYNNIIVAFFANNEIFIINKNTAKIIDIYKYDTIKIEKNILILDDKKINLETLSTK